MVNRTIILSMVLAVLLLSGDVHASESQAGLRGRSKIERQGKVHSLQGSVMNLQLQIEDHLSGAKFLHERKLESVQRHLQKYEEMLSELVGSSSNYEEML